MEDDEESKEGKVKEGKLEESFAEGMEGQYDFKGESIFERDGSIRLSMIYHILSKYPSIKELNTL